MTLFQIRSSLYETFHISLHIDYILIDEYSMLGQSTLGWIDSRCKQATGMHNQVLGGKSLILIGDPGQFPPVADKPLYQNKLSSAIGEQGYQTCM